ncbi:hypothetical protein KBB06_04865 [Candidatus Gracilibacteria bacterium]|nr:hypothetical protein [Candidatus Gracilibacteria bacterium]
MTGKLSDVNNITYENCGNSGALTKVLSKRVNSSGVQTLADIVASCRKKCGDVKDECWELCFNDEGKVVSSAVKPEK